MLYKLYKEIYNFLYSLIFGVILFFPQTQTYSKRSVYLHKFFFYFVSALFAILHFFDSIGFVQTKRKIFKRMHFLSSSKFLLNFSCQNGSLEFDFYKFKVYANQLHHEVEHSVVNSVNYAENSDDKLIDYDKQPK